MSAFEDRLWTYLVSEHGELLAPEDDRSSVGRERRPRRGRATRLRRRVQAFGLVRRAPALLVVAGAAVAVAIAVFAIVALRHVRPPSVRRLPSLSTQHFSASPPPHPIQDDRYIERSINRGQKRDRKCDSGPVGPRGGTISNGTPSRAMLSVLGVLRRPATPQDVLPSQWFSRGRLIFSPGATDVYIHYVRLARVVNGVSVFIVPAGKVGVPSPPAATLTRCKAEDMAALRALLPTVPRKLRASTLRYGAWVFNPARIIATEQGVHEGAFQIMEAGNGSESTGGDSPSMIEADGFLGASDNVIDGVVPSGVASVTLHFPAGGHGSHRLPPISLSSNVIGNVFVMTIPNFGAARYWPSTMIWRAASGAVSKTINEEQFHP